MEPRTKKIIIIIGIILILLILGLVISRYFFAKSTSNINSINDQLLNDISNSLDQDENLVIAINSEVKNTAIVERGTEGLGIPIGFAPKNPQVWGTAKNGCKYNIETELEECIVCCLNQGWTNPLYDIYPGTRNQLFDEVYEDRGYSLIKINIPKDIEPCVQPFVVTVSCTGYPNETVSNYFNIQVIKRKLF